MEIRFQDQFADSYSELRSIAVRQMRSERRGRVLNPTALVHEAYLRLDRGVSFHNRAEFLSLVSITMRRILVDQARRRAAARRGGGVTISICETDCLEAPQSNWDTCDLNRLIEKLAASKPRQARVIELRVFAGLSVDSVAAALSVSPRTVKSDYRCALAWLRRELEPPIVRARS